MREKTAIIIVLFCILSCNDSVKHTGNIIPNDEYKYDSIFDKGEHLIEVRRFRDKELEQIVFFAEKNAIRKVIKYMKIDNKTYPNQFIEMNGNGDTLYNKSLYYDLYFVKDSISIDEKYSFKIVLTGHIFDSARINLCNFDENFNLDSLTSACDIFKMDNLETKLKTPGKVKGWNYIRAKIDNYQNYRDSEGKDSSAYASIYLLDSFYVKE